MRRLSRATEDVLLVLSSDLGKEWYGVEVMRASGLSSGSLYPILERLEDRELIEGEWEDEATAAAERRPRRRYYRLSARGRAVAAEVRSSLAARLGPAVGGLA